MPKFRSLSVCNVLRRPARSVALILLTAVMSLSILGGSLIILGLRGGLNSLEARLGADIMVVPYEASTKSDLTGIILQGNPGYFYMDDAVMDKLAAREGVEKISAQFFLASSTSSCCSYKVQIIGFDPETDFVIKPWVDMSYDGELGDMEVFVGSSLNAFSGDELTFYGTTVTVAARLDKTGTYLDTAVYATEKTIKTLIASAKESKIYDFGSVDPDEIVSCVLIDVADGYTVEDVLNDINIHVRKVEAVQTQNMVSDVSKKLTGVAGVAGGLVVGVWLLMLAVMVIAFVMIANERKKEFAVLRILGASRRQLSFILLKEILIIALLGSFVGAVLSLIVVSAFGDMIEQMLSMPFLLPDAPELALIAVCAVIVCVAAAALASLAGARRISRIDTAIVLRGENG